MCLKTAAILAAFVAAAASPAVGQERLEVALLLGSTSATNAGPALQLDRGTTYQATVAWRFRDVGRVALALEVPFIASPAFDVATPEPELPLNYASLYLTPGVRATLPLGRAVSVFGAAGAGYARYTESGRLANREANPLHRDTNTGAVQLGGGVTLRGLSWLGFRAEVRDVYTGRRQLSIAARGRRVHNVAASGGFVVRF